ncbi:MAG: recombinase family protein [Planctomycetales bacterium]|nr:recombinase family protein [Planctomycetales bacterium]
MDAGQSGKTLNRERCGKIRFGYELAEDGKTLVENSLEQDAIRLIESLKTKGESLRSIADELTIRGILTKEGNAKWTHTAVSRILKRAA